MGYCQNSRLTSICFATAICLSVLAFVSGEDGLLMSDGASLLSFMSKIVLDPDNALQSWNFSGSHVCNWTGVVCWKNRVVQLDLSGKSLHGTISPALSNLSHLAVLDLSENFFSGQIPAELGCLTRLKQLSFESNFLEGIIPVVLGDLRRLVYLNLGGNRLVGQIPTTLLCNSTSLQYIDLSNNSLGGKIPMETRCKVKDLRFLLLWSNRLTGAIPISLSNSSNLEWLDLESNSLSGELPVDMFQRMPHLQFLYLSYNKLVSFDGNTNLSPFFTSLVNCSHLQELELAGNGLSGELPSSLGDLPTSLLQLHFEENLIYGSIPSTISNLVNLTLLNLSSNMLKGSIPSEIGRLGKLERLYLSSNTLSEEVPSAFGDIPHLGLLDLSKNKLSGTIPDSLSNLTQLRRLRLNENFLTGPIPPSLGGCINLEILDLSYNRISGFMPNEVAGLGSLKIYLNLSSNLLEGPLPLELSKMDMVLAIDLSSNKLSGTIPPQLGGCIALEYLNLSTNLLSGALPVSVGELPYLEVLDLSMNQLTGEIPLSLKASSTLRQLNLSSNNFSGFVPSEGAFTSLRMDSFLGNKGLCGLVAGMSPCRNKRRRRWILVLPILLTLFVTPGCIACFCGYPLVLKPRSRRSFRSFSTRAEDEEQGMRHEANFPRISYRQLIEATSGFDDSSIIGSGRTGHVYKGTLQDGTRIAVKVLDLRIDGEILGSFRRECQILRKIRHRNLIRIMTVCSRPDFKAIVLPLMVNGSLDSHLYPSHDSGSGLNLMQLVSICSDVAEGLAYLHHHSPVQVVHCDLKPSNILLDDDMTAIVSDFGIAKLVKGDGEHVEIKSSTSNSTETESSTCNSTQGLLCGSIGYIAPEYGMGRQSSRQGDVFSYGVLLLEIVTGKSPTDIIFQAGATLHEWVKRHYALRLDPIMEGAVHRIPPIVTGPESGNVWREVVLELIELGLMCTQSSPSMRPTMVDISLEMGRLKQYLSRDAALIVEASSTEVSSS